MTADSLPFRLLLAALAGWVNRHQQHVIDYLVEENRALREQLRGRRVRLSDDQRRRLAARGQRLGRRVLRQGAAIGTPDTSLRRYRRPDGPKGGVGVRGAGTSGANERDRGAHRSDGDRESRLGLQPHPGCVEEPQSLRREKYCGQGPKGPWNPAGARAAFLVADLSAGAHWGAIAGADFFTTEVWTARGLVTYYTLFVLDLKSRRVEIVGSTRNPDAAFNPIGRYFGSNYVNMAGLQAVISASSTGTPAATSSGYPTSPPN